jgi:DNA-directed RNA polymerase subunit RPC12/RpoP
MAEQRESNKDFYVVYECLDCGWIQKVEMKKEEYNEISVCPTCKGRFVDRWKKANYISEPNPNKNSLKVKIDVDCADALKGLKAVTRAAKDATAALKELEEHQSKIEYVMPLNVNSIDLSKSIVRALDNLNKRVGI